MIRVGAIQIFGGVKTKDEKLSIKTAKEILGKDKVFSSDEVVRVWDKEKIPEKIIPFWLETLERCAAENAAAKADWRLVYGLGQSMTEMFLARGDGKKGQPCFHAEHNYYPPKIVPYEPCHAHQHYEEASPWIAKGKREGYRLIDMKPRFRKISFAEQEELIKSLGPKFFRTSAQVFAEAVFSIFMLSGQRIAENWHHWAPEKHMYGNHAAIGRFIPHGLVFMPGYEGSGHSAVISRESDI